VFAYGFERQFVCFFKQGSSSIGLTLYSLDKILNGNIGDVIDALITADTALKLGQEA
jgi:protein subunit release factor A